jgi:hypothetical protein
MAHALPPYICFVCERRFASMESLEVHERDARCSGGGFPAPAAVATWHFCNGCAKKFRSIDALDRHERRAHPKPPSSHPASFKVPAPAAVENLQKLQGDVYLGTILVFRQLMHFYAVRVETVDGIQQATNDPDGHFKPFESIEADGPFETATIPGLEGEYAFLAYSYLD